jgi:hypothetical protein
VGLRSKKVYIPVFAIVAIVVAYDVLFLLREDGTATPEPEIGSPEWTSPATLEAAAPESAGRPRAAELLADGRDPFWFEIEKQTGATLDSILAQGDERARREESDRRARLHETIEHEDFSDRLSLAQLRGIVCGEERSVAWIDGEIVRPGSEYLVPGAVVERIEPDRVLFRFGNALVAKHLAPAVVEDDDAGTGETDPGAGPATTTLPVSAPPAASAPAAAATVPVPAVVPAPSGPADEGSGSRP